MKILCVGQSAYDITIPVDKYPEENKKYKIHEVVECGGGSCNNAAYLLAKWHDEVYLASTIGKDIYGENIKKELNSIGVNTSFFEEIDGVNTTVSYIINNKENGSRTIITNRSPKMHFSDGFNISLKPDVILLDGNDYEMSLKVIKENKEAIKIIDAGSLKPGTVELSKLCDYVVCSNDFAKEYTKIDFKYDEKDKIRKVYNLLEKDFSGKVIITLESLGSLTKINDQFFLVPSIKVDSVDSTGAGDIYHGAFTYFIANNYDFKEAIRLSNIAGALSVTKIGSKNSMPTLSEVLNYHE